MGIWNSSAGLVTLRITSADLPHFFEQITARGIPVFDMKPQDDLTADFVTYRMHHAAVAALAGKRGEKLELLERTGVFWTVKRLLRRPVLVVGLLLLLALVFFLPTRVLFVEVEGNHSVSTKRIIETAEECGIFFGASREGVRSEKVKNAMLERLPQLQWVGVNTRGCVAVISLRERPESSETQQETGVSNIIASRDGVVLSCTAEQGSALCKSGQAVAKGEILISGYTDCGLLIQATRAKGEVFARTEREISAVTPSNLLQRGENTGIRTGVSLLVGKKRINLWKYSGISLGSCGRMYEEYYVTLPGGLQLPLGIAVERWTDAELEEAEVSLDEAQQLLRAFAEDDLRCRMVAGTVTAREETVTEEDGGFCLNGSYSCEEMIGREHPEELEIKNGKTSGATG